jgi:uncharacterized membrane protein YuzA (DUF378 family)
MANADLVNYIRSEQGNNTPLDQIREKLLSVGWSPADIDSAFSFVVSSTASPAIQDQEKRVGNSPEPVKHNTPILVNLGAIYLGLAGIFAGYNVIIQYVAYSRPSSSFQLIVSVVGIAEVAAAYGLSNMKKWGLYTFSVLCLAGTTVSILSAVGNGKIEFINFLPVILLLIFWAYYPKYS